MDYSEDGRGEGLASPEGAQQSLGVSTLDRPDLGTTCCRAPQCRQVEMLGLGVCTPWSTRGQPPQADVS